MRLFWLLIAAFLFTTAAQAQTTAVVSPPEKARYFDNNGNICSGCLVFSYAGGSNTPIATYTDSTGGTPNANPVVLDATGQGNIWFLPTVTYKISLSPVGDTTNTNPFWTVDNVSVASPITIPIANNKLANSTITVAGHVVSLGGSTTLQASDLTNGTAGSSGKIVLLNTSLGATGTTIVSNGSQYVAGYVPGSGINGKSANYSILTTDCGQRIVYDDGAQHTLTLPAAAGFTNPCDVSYINENSGNGIIMSGFPSGQFYILYPGQSGTVSLANGAWTLAVNPGRWQKNGAAFYASTNTGSNTANDCITVSTPCLTISHTLANMKTSLDAQNGPPSLNVACGQYIENVTGSGQLTGYNFWQLTGATAGGSGTPACASLQPATAGAALLISDNDEVQVTNMNFSNAGNISGASGVALHQFAIIDFLAGNTFYGSAFVDDFECDSNGRINISNSMDISTSAVNFMQFAEGCSFSWASTATVFWKGTPNIAANIISLGAGAIGILNGMGFSGSLTCNQQWAVTGNSTLSLGGTTVSSCSNPGAPSTGSTPYGGQVSP